LKNRWNFSRLLSLCAELAQVLRRRAYHCVCVRAGRAIHNHAKDETLTPLLQLAKKSAVCERSSSRGKADFADELPSAMR
jgi:hypothetical protein